MATRGPIRASRGSRLTCRGWPQEAALRMLMNNLDPEVAERPEDLVAWEAFDAIADWPILNALLNVASGASWVSFHHGGGVGIGNSLHAGQVIVADGTPAARERLQRVLTNDPGIGVARHADAGYAEAVATARAHGIDLPMHG